MSVMTMYVARPMIIRRPICIFTGAAKRSLGWRELVGCLEDIIEFCIVERLAQPQRENWKKVLDTHRDKFLSQTAPICRTSGSPSCGLGVETSGLLRFRTP